MPCPPGALRSKVKAHPKVNWVDEQGGLPRYIERIACHLHFDKGYADVGEAIAIAVNVAKKMCETGDVNFPGIQHVKPEHQAEACEAVSHWEEMKAAARGKSAAKAVAKG